MPGLFRLPDGYIGARHASLITVIARWFETVALELPASAELACHGGAPWSARHFVVRFTVVVRLWVLIVSKKY